MKLLAVLALPAAMAWWDGGHYISGSIARATLLAQGKEDAVKWVEKILRMDPEYFESNSDFLTAPTWMDDVKSQYTNNTTSPARPAIRTWDNNHFMNIPIEDGCHSETCIKDYSAMTKYLAQGINHIDVLLGGALAHLAPEGSTRRPGNGDAWATQLHLRWLFHLMGDAHMPLHMTGMWHRGLWECPALCEEDWCTKCKEASEDEGGKPGKSYLKDEHHCNGGNYIYIKLDEENWPKDMDKLDATNLHAFWDSMGGFAQKRASTISAEDKEALAKIVMEEYPFEEMKPFKIWGNNWTLKDDVYPYVYKVAAIGAPEDIDENGKQWYVFMDLSATNNLCLNSMTNAYCQRERSYFVTEEYRAWAEKASKRLVALAGYRLADALNRLHEGLPDRLKKDIDDRLRGTSGASSLLTLGAGVLVSGALLAAL